MLKSSTPQERIVWSSAKIDVSDRLFYVSADITMHSSLLCFVVPSFRGHLPSLFVGMQKDIYATSCLLFFLLSYGKPNQAIMTLTNHGMLHQVIA